MGYLFIGLVLILANASSAQNVSIELTPITYLIVLPDSGGSFDYLLTVTNQGGTPITATVWCMATLPNGSSWGPVLGPATQTLAAGQTQSYHRTQTVPPRAAYGYYMLHAYVGIYPDTVWAQDQFEFQHQAVSGTEQLWVARYNGPGNGDDLAYSLALDAAGNVYVTGFSFVTGTNADYATIKYDPGGNQIWAARYNGPGNCGDVARSLALDGGNNVYVTGYSAGIGNNPDYATIKYDPSGNQLWAVRYNGPANDNDVAYSLAVDGDNNVYVTGYSAGIGTNYDYATIKYDPSGNQLWVARYNGPVDGTDEAYSLAVDGGNNVYVTGYSAGIGNNYDYATIKYDPSGNQLWVARYNGPANDNDVAYSLTVDGDGNIYVSGWSIGSGTYWDYATIKYDPSGNQLWVSRYNGPGNFADVAYSLAVDGGNNVYVTGYSVGIGTYYDYATIKYDASGNQLWAARYNGPGNGADIALSLAVDDDSNVYVTGQSDIGGPYYEHYDFATVKYDAFGDQLWVARYNGLGNYDDWGSSLAVDGDGHVYVTGRSAESAVYPYNYDFVTIKYSGGNIANWLPVEATVLGQPLPQESRLEENYPNPFNASTVIRYKMQDARQVSLRIYDTAGRLVETLVDGWRPAGTHELTFDASGLPSGMYFARLEAGDYVGVQKLILLK